MAITQRQLAARYIHMRLQRGELAFIQLSDLTRAFQSLTGLPPDGLPGPKTCLKVITVNQGQVSTTNQRLAMVEGVLRGMAGTLENDPIHRNIPAELVELADTVKGWRTNDDS